MPRHDLCISYSGKDELKKSHKIRFDPEKKLWYILAKDLPQGLKKYQKTYVEIDYDDKDVMKQKFKSLRFDFDAKSWYCSLEDYEALLGGHKS